MLIGDVSHLRENDTCVWYRRSEPKDLAVLASSRQWTDIPEKGLDPDL